MLLQRGLGLLLIVYSSVCTAQTGITRIEEDWELRIAEPDPQIDAPQINATMMPFGSDHPLNFQFDINHASEPSFNPGGLQIRTCYGDECLTQLRHFEGEKLSQESETITWTQVAWVSNNGYSFGISNGNSSTWGSFGGQDYVLQIGLSDASGGTLNNYTPAASLSNSGVSFSGNRVAHFRLKEVRIFNSLGQVSQLDIQANVQ